EQLLALALGLLALRDVAQDHRVELLARDDALRDPRLHRELVAVPAQRGQHALAAHLAAADAGLAERPDERVVTVAKTRGDEALDRLPDRICGGAVEDVL